MPPNVNYRILLIRQNTRTHLSTPKAIQLEHKGSPRGAPPRMATRSGLRPRLAARAVMPPPAWATNRKKTEKSAPNPLIKVVLEKQQIWDGFFTRFHQGDRVRETARERGTNYPLTSKVGSTSGKNLLDQERIRLKRRMVVLQKKKEKCAMPKVSIY